MGWLGHLVLLGLLGQLGHLALLGLLRGLALLALLPYRTWALLGLLDLLDSLPPAAYWLTGRTASLGPAWAYWPHWLGAPPPHISTSLGLADWLLGCAAARLRTLVGWGTLTSAHSGPFFFCCLTRAARSHRAPAGGPTDPT